MKYKNDGKTARYEADKGMTIMVTHRSYDPFANKYYIDRTYHPLWISDGYIIRGYSDNWIDAISDNRVIRIEEVIA